MWESSVVRRRGSVASMMIIAVLAICFLSVAFWIQLIDRKVRGGAILAFEPRRPVPWTFVDLLLAGFAGAAVLILFQSVAIASLRLPAPFTDMDSLTTEQQIFVSTVTSFSSFGFLAVGHLIFRRRHQVTGHDLGWDQAMLERDVTLGVGGYLMLVVPMLLIHLLVQLAWPTKETHPFIQLLMDQPRWQYWVPIALMAVGVAPIVEEFVFRVAFQGWLESLAVRWEQTRLPVTNAPATSVPTELNPIELNPTEANDSAMPIETRDVTRSISPSDGIHYAYATETEAVSMVADAESATSSARDLSGIPRTKWGQWGPIVTSSLLFALAHVGQGGAPVALFFLALGLGYIYQRTHRVMPTVVVHCLVNLTAMLQLWQYVR